MPRNEGLAEIGVLADDLTGAMLAAARLREHGMRTITVSPPATPAGGREGRDLPLSAQALVINLGTRDLPPTAERSRNAARLARTWGHKLWSNGCRRFELRADSLLRGDHVAELSGLLAGISRLNATVLAVTAYPGADRITRDGHQIGAIAGERFSVDVKARLFPDDEAWIISKRWVRDGPESVVAAVRDRLAAGLQRFVADAETNEDLKVLAAAAASLESETPLVTISSSAWLRFHPMGFRPERDFVIVAITADSIVNRRQIDRLPTAHQLTPADALSLSIDVADTDTLLRNGPTLLVLADHHNKPIERQGLGAADEVAQAVLALLNLARRAGHSCRGIIASGGLTASRIAAELGSHELWPEGELSALCPSGIVSGGSWTGLRLVCKSAAIGDEDTLVDLVNQLWSRPSADAPQTHS